MICKGCQNLPWVANLIDQPNLTLPNWPINNNSLPIRQKKWKKIKGFKIFKVQSNLSTTATLGTPKKWPLYRVGRSLQVFQSKLVLKVALRDLGWPLLTGGRYSEVAVNTGLTVETSLRFPDFSCCQC